jgi:hypothetical protein
MVTAAINRISIADGIAISAQTEAAGVINFDTISRITAVNPVATISINTTGDVRLVGKVISTPNLQFAPFASNTIEFLSSGTSVLDVETINGASAGINDNNLITKNGLGDFLLRFITISSPADGIFLRGGNTTIVGETLSAGGIGIRLTQSDHSPNLQVNVTTITSTDVCLLSDSTGDVHFQICRATSTGSSVVRVEIGSQVFTSSYTYGGFFTPASGQPAVSYEGIFPPSINKLLPSMLNTTSLNGSIQNTTGNPIVITASPTSSQSALGVNVTVDPPSAYLGP